VEYIPAEKGKKRLEYIPVEKFQSKNSGINSSRKIVVESNRTGSKTELPPNTKRNGTVSGKTNP